MNDTHYYDYEVEAAYMPSDEDYRGWTETRMSTPRRKIATISLRVELYTWDGGAQTREVLWYLQPNDGDGEPRFLGRVATMSETGAIQAGHKLGYDINLEYLS